MTGVLEHLVVAPRPRVLARERRRPDRRVVDGEAVDELVGALHSEALDHRHVSRAPREGRAIPEVGGLHDQGVTLPVPDRIPQPLPDLRRIVLGVHPDDPRIVVHLGQDHDVVFGLHDPLLVVVEDRQHRRAGRGAEPEQAALRERPLLHVVERARRIQTGLEPVRGAVVLTRAPATTPSRGGCVSGDPRLGPRRIPAVRGIDEDGGAPLPVDLERPGARVDPEGVVAPDVPRGTGRPVPSYRRCAAIRVAELGIHRGDDVVAAIERGRRPFPERRRLLIGQRHRLTQLGRTLHRRQRPGVVGAGQVRTTARRPRNVVGLCRRDRRQAQDRKPRHTDRYSTAHVTLLKERNRRHSSRSLSAPQSQSFRSPRRSTAQTPSRTR